MFGKKKPSSSTSDGSATPGDVLNKTQKSPKVTKNPQKSQKSPKVTKNHQKSPKIPKNPFFFSLVEVFYFEEKSLN